MPVLERILGLRNAQRNCRPALGEMIECEYLLRQSSRRIAEGVDSGNRQSDLLCLGRNHAGKHQRVAKTVLVLPHLGDLEVMERLVGDIPRNLVGESDDIQAELFTSDRLIYRIANRRKRAPIDADLQSFPSHRRLLNSRDPVAPAPGGWSDRNISFRRCIWHAVIAITARRCIISTNLYSCQGWIFPQ